MPQHPVDRRGVVRERKGTHEVEHLLADRDAKESRGRNVGHHEIDLRVWTPVRVRHADVGEPSSRRALAASESLKSPTTTSGRYAWIRRPILLHIPHQVAPVIEIGWPLSRAWKNWAAGMVRMFPHWHRDRAQDFSIPAVISHQDVVLIPNRFGQ